jgi:hypothetical protein
LLEDAEQGAWQRIQGALIDGLLAGLHLQLAPEDRPDLLWREAMRLLRSWLK